MKRLFTTAFCAMALVIGAGNVSAQGLKDAYKKYFTIGVAVNPRNISTPEHIEIIKANFNSITAENVMKPGEMHPREGVWNYEQADAVANFCRENGIKLRGHCLVWHSQFANWMFSDENGQPVTKEVFYERLKDHIFTVVNRYKDVVYAWDVVNEAMSDTPGKDYEGSFRNSRLYQLCGDEFIAKAFEYAHEADPKALLFYNDYNAANPHKTEYIYNMVKKMQEQGVPITGIPFRIAYEFGIWTYADKDMVFPKCLYTTSYIYGDLYAEAPQPSAVISPPQDCLLEVKIKFRTDSDPVIEPYVHESSWSETGSEGTHCPWSSSLLEIKESGISFDATFQNYFRLTPIWRLRIGNHGDQKTYTNG